MTLMELVAQATTLEQLIIENGGEITQDIEDALNKNGSELKTKIDGYSMLLDTLKQRKAYAIDRMRQWENIISSVEKAEENLTSRLHQAMINLDLSEVCGQEFLVRVQQNPPKCKIVDEKLIPGQFLQTVMETKVLKKEILDALKKGTQVPGCDIERTSRIVIKPSLKRIEK